MNASQVLRKIKTSRPSTPSEFRALGIPLIKEGAGSFRIVMRVRGLNLAVKFPQSYGPEMGLRVGKMHSTVEVRKINKLKRIPWMRPHIPRVYFHDKKSGVLVVSWHPEFRNTTTSFRALGRLMTKVIAKKTGITVSDIHEDNTRRGRTAKDSVLVDLGY